MQFLYRVKQSNKPTGERRLWRKHWAWRRRNLKELLNQDQKKWKEESIVTRSDVFALKIWISGVGETTLFLSEEKPIDFLFRTCIMLIVVLLRQLIVNEPVCQVINGIQACVLALSSSVGKKVNLRRQSGGWLFWFHEESLENVLFLTNWKWTRIQ